MMKAKRKTFITNTKLYISLLGILFSLLCITTIHAQESVFSAFKYYVQDADKAFIAGNYQKALEIYEVINKQKGAPENIELRLARSYYFTYQYQKAVQFYKSFEKKKQEFPIDDYYYYAEALMITGDIVNALEYYKLCLENRPNNELYSERIWRLNNLSYLYEDSSKNITHFSNINTNYSELQMLKSATNEVMYISNSPSVSLFKKIDVKENAGFYTLKQNRTYADPFSIVALNYEDQKTIGGHLNTPFHISSISLYNNGNSMAYTASANQKNNAGNFPLQLYFADKIKGKWKMTNAFHFNNSNFDISEVWISEDGKKLIFSANFKDSFGGKDLYQSEKNEKGWTKPVNIGNEVNTERDERFPYLQGSTLYFSSNGHSGLGGFDIYRYKTNQNGMKEIENLGYPINSNFDEISFTIDSLGQEGFLSSNRKNKGFDYDIYEFALDLQSYPMSVEGNVKFIEHNWMDSTELETLPNVKMELIDLTKNVVVATTSTDSKGNFKLRVPFYSRFKIRIIGNDLDGLVSFEVPKFAKQDLSYEIVVVNDDFKNTIPRNAE
ncbi:tetratricopeptide repeat protein [Marivirga arenosa]|uniref:Tetratricopeptide repeat protein n=1 Tax=Marivirga arenosa TaxID=3059076 RepID=A0AA51X3I4_9BACT|nr:tetratricopeptide repeat protein [Marivirga sp. BKB1-2]WNB16941.1 tetratricopeptide repeat protein [Marivirga sp. BKB1-2]